MSENITLLGFENNILKEATEIWKAEKFCDAILRTEDGGKFKIHRVILTMTSNYFRALFRHGGEKREFTIPGITSEMLEILVRSVYTGITDITEDNVAELLPAAEYLILEKAVRDCTEFLVGQLGPENCIGFRNFAKIYFQFQLEIAAEKYLLSNFLEVSQCSEEFLELSPEEIVALLSHDRLHVTGEEQVWVAVLKWVDHAPEERKAHVHEVLKCVRLGLLETTYFMAKIKQHPYVVDNAECRRTIIAMLRFLWDLEEISSKVEPVETPLLATPRIPHHVLFAIGGWSGGAPTDQFETYDTKADRWIQVGEVDPSGPRAYHKLAVMGHDIYVIGGFNGHEYFRSCRCFNAVTKQWRDVAPMNCKRCYVSVATIGDHIYAMGGFDGDHRQNSVERYDHRRNQWTLLNPMNSQRSDACATTHEGRIYIVGGFNGAECLATAERYEPDTDTWTQVAPMQQRRSGVAVVSHNGYIYAVGGFNGVARLLSGERYDPSTDQWSPIQDMFNPRSNFAIEVMDDMLFAMGGFNGVTTIFHVECYNDRTNEWLEATDMNVYRSALAACVIPGLPNVDAYVHPNRSGLMEEKRQKLLQQRTMAERRQAERREAERQANAAALVPFYPPINEN